MSHLYVDSTPEAVTNAKGLHLITKATPNGHKVQILLEELKEVYGVQWSTTLIEIRTNEQKEWFLRLNPNGRIPTTPCCPPVPVMETSAELVYFAEKYDKDNKFFFTDPVEKTQALQWLFFWHGSGAPYQGQLIHFGLFANEKIPYAIERFKNETLRVFGVLEIHLSGKFTGELRGYLAGLGKGRYSIADIGTWPWIKGWELSGLTSDDVNPFPYLLGWIDRIKVEKGTGDAYNLEKHPELYVSPKQ